MVDSGACKPTFSHAHLGVCCLCLTGARQNPSRTGDEIMQLGLSCVCQFCASPDHELFLLPPIFILCCLDDPLIPCNLYGQEAPAQSMSKQQRHVWIYILWLESDSSEVRVHLTTFAFPSFKEVPPPPRGTLGAQESLVREKKWRELHTVGALFHFSHVYPKVGFHQVSIKGWRSWCF